MLKHASRIICSSAKRPIVTFKLQLRHLSHDSAGVSLQPYVDPKYSYAFGRSTGTLIYKTLPQGLLETVEKYPDRIAFVSNHQKITKTYSQFNQDVNKLSRSLINDIKIQKGDVAGCWSMNLYEYFVVQHSLARIGAINCSLSPAYKTPELEYVLKKGNFKALFMPRNDKSQQGNINSFHEILSSVDQKITKNLKNIIFFEGQSEQFDPNLGLTSYSYDELISGQSGLQLKDDIVRKIDPEEAACIYWTSGTTGKPKGATLNHFGIMNNVQTLAYNKRKLNPEDDLKLCVPLPLFHVFAGMIGTYLSCVIPQTIILPDYKYSAKSTVDAITKYQCTDVWLVPTMIVDVNNYIKKKIARGHQIDTSSLKVIGSGAAPCPVEVVKEAQELFPSLNLLSIGYGSTETSAITSYPNDDVPQSVINDTCGQPLDHVEVKIINPAIGKVVPLGETGELCIRGFNIMMGYLDEPDKTAEVIKNGWYHSGDLATIDDQGLIRIVGRTKELIIRGGSNIYPREIEELLHEHPEVLNVAVCGIPHPKLGEEVCAWVELRDPNANVTHDDIKNYCRDKISYYKVPQYVIFVKEFPMTASGKFQKFIMTEKSIEILGLGGKKVRNDQK